MLQGGMRWGMEKAIKAASEATKYAHDLGLMVTFFPSDASRSDIEFLSTLLNGVLNAGGHFDSVALVDTFGAFSPRRCTASRISDIPCCPSLSPFCRCFSW